MRTVPFILVVMGIATSAMAQTPPSGVGSFYNEYLNIVKALEEGVCPKTLSQPESTWTKGDVLGSMKTYGLEKDISTRADQWKKACGA
ncbi:hypothetical protein A2419_00305 [Candidatus Adlerbacteria bacterium RIFOXYC1_FULL_48_26]|uniref:SLH domain-containing protein n=1 Tax=Candidatus Adlerbacteria bacterium RIFOXYC1_FULL_48_26 TaxID=1797247 RepID=A0A1F4Y347_9BACT|nr:MAG: hypothetical protein A2419_00305 [Candidatus Adlerbacteria bacterium RIFOXYC1_FULL_48_26]OGC93401.1 MAG: hypothetical protein A2389_02530 [Candidatus Adlerbacteria bacterium RIFOXYB1_FULL_48_10]OGC95032.1 MAG: hypothetical protein A2590_01990 [Candidatus Adlerbacteria bacterium RIFOXYD1_FULL_48_8]